MLHDDDVIGRAYDARLMRRFLAYLRPHAGLVTLCLLLVLALTAAELSAPHVLQQAIDGPIRGSDSTGVLLWALVLLGVLLAQGALEFLGAWFTHLAGQRICYDIRRDVFAHLQRLPLGFYDGNPVGRLVIRVTGDIETLKELFTSGFVAVAADLLTLAGIVSVLFAKNARLAGTLFLVVPLMIATALVFRVFARRYYREIRRRIARLNAYLNENVMGMRVVQLFNREAHNRGVFESLNADHATACLHSVRAYALFFPSINTLVIASQALLLWAGGVQILEDTITFGAFFAFWWYLQKFYHPILDLAEKYNILQAAMASSERVFKLLDTPVAIASPAAPVRPAAPLRGDIEFRNVTFAYTEPHVVLDDLSLRIRPGEHVALVGATGGGKTTIASLLIRLYEAGRGQVLIDGVEVRDYDPAWLRRQVGIVLQDVFCFTGTIASNIRLGEAGIPQDRIEAAARIVNADRFILRRAGGYDAAVRERGATLSLGEKQLLGFARALAMDPRILVLDEATSSVDTETETLIQDALRQAIAGRTALIIAHRLSTIQACDRILVLHKGRIREEGTHAELLAHGGLYRRLVELQAARRPAPGWGRPPAPTPAAPGPP